MSKLKTTGIFGILGFLLAALYTKVIFLRQPERKIPHNDNLLVSPANGKVIGVRRYNLMDKDPAEQFITEFKNNSTLPGAIRIFGGDVATTGYVISIALNLSNVHYQRAPTGSVVIKKNYTEGNFKNALQYNNELFFRFENEHNEILLSANSGNFKYKVVQIAGFMARFIEDYVTIGQEVKQGDIIGLIKLGSQVTVVLPDMDILVKEGDYLIDGETPIARM